MILSSLMSYELYVLNFELLTSNLKLITLKLLIENDVYLQL